MQILKLKNLSFLLIFCLTALVIISCGDDDEGETECLTENLTYDNFAKGFITSNCGGVGGLGCHGSTPGEGTFQMTDYEMTKGVVDFGNVLKVINHEAGVIPMPFGGDKLDACSINKMTAWVNDGAPE